MQLATNTYNTIIELYVSGMHQQRIADMLEIDVEDVEDMLDEYAETEYA